MILCLAALIGVISASTGKEHDHREMWAEIDACVNFSNRVDIPEKCRAWMGNPPAFEINKQEGVFNFCKNKVYYKYLSHIGGMHARDSSIGVPIECADFIAVYHPFLQYSSLPHISGSVMATFGQRAIVMGRALRLLQKLHDAGFSHGNINGNAFGTDFQLLYTGKGVKVDTLLLGHLMDVKSVYTRDGDLSFEGAIAQKKDLLDFAKKFVPILFPDSRIAKKFLCDVERTEIDNWFKFSDWQDTLSALQITGDDSRVAIPDRGRVVFSALQAGPVKDWSRAYDTCMAERFHSVRRRVDIRAGIRSLMSAELGNLVPVVEKGSSDSADPLFYSHISGLTVQVVQLGDENDQICRQESTFEVINGLDGFAPRLFKVRSPAWDRNTPSGYVMEYLGPSLDPAFLLDEANRPLLYQAMASAIQAIERLHKRGLVHNDIAKGESLHVSADGTVRIIKFVKASRFVGANGRHLTGSYASYRRTDMEQLGGMVATELQFQDELIRDFFIDMEALDREDTPDYDVWIELFLREAAQRREVEEEAVAPVVVQGLDEMVAVVPPRSSGFDMRIGGSDWREFQETVLDEWLLAAHNV